MKVRRCQVFFSTNFCRPGVWQRGAAGQWLSDPYPKTAPARIRQHGIIPKENGISSGVSKYHGTPLSETMQRRTSRVIHCVPEAFAAYRYLLEIPLCDAAAPRLTVILKNPSTASTTRSDPTIGKIAAWARRHGFAAVACVNLFALRATQPTALNQYSYAVIVGPENDAYIHDAVGAADVVVAA
jgi:hypothetical protein